MIDYDTWLQDPWAGDVEDEPRQAALAWHAILQKPTTVVFKDQSGTKLTAQQVRLEYSDNNSQIVVESEAGKSVARRLFIFGVIGHPDDAVPDTDMEEGYRFIHNNDEYDILDVVFTTGEIQALAEARG